METRISRVKTSSLPSGTRLVVTTRTTKYTLWFREDSKVFIMTNNHARPSGEAEILGSMNPLSGEMAWGILEMGSYMVYSETASTGDAVKTSLILRIEAVRPAPAVRVRMPPSR